MAFSEGFNNTFRSLDNAYRWRSNEAENARQFDLTHGENVRMNDSRIDLNEAQIGRLQALTKLVSQEVDFNKQTNPVRLEGLNLENENRRLLNTNQRTQNETAQLQLTENQATSQGRVDATNAQNRTDALLQKIAELRGRATYSQELMQTFVKEDGSMPTGIEMAQNPKDYAAAIATMSASSEITGDGFGEDSIALMKPHYENGKFVGYIAMEESTPGGPLRVDPDSVDANGEPRVISVEEAAQIYDALLGKLNQSASWGAQGGSARDRLVLGQARDRATALADPKPQALPVAEEYQGRKVEELQAEGDALEAQLAELQAQREALTQSRQRAGSRTLGQNGQNGVFGETGLNVPSTLTEVEQEQMAELDQREQVLKGQLAALTQNLQAIGQNETLGQRQNSWQSAVEQTARSLRDVVRRNESINGANYTAEQNRNLWTTGRSDTTPEAAQADFAKTVNNLANTLADGATFTVYEDGKLKTVADKRGGEHLRSQLTTLANSDPQFKAMVKDPRLHGVIQKIGLDATALAGVGNEPNLSMAWQLFTEGVEAGRLGQVMQLALAQLNSDGDAMDPDTQAAVGKAAAEVLRNNPNMSPGAAAQRALLNLRK